MDAVDTRAFLQAKLVDILLVLGFGALTAGRWLWTYGSPAAVERLMRELPPVASTPERGDCEPHAAGADVRGTRW